MLQKLIRVDIGTVPRRKPTPCPLRSRFGANVAQARVAAGLTQEALAEKVGVSARYLQSLEAGEYLPPIPKLVKLNAALGLTWDGLFRGCE